MQPSVHHLSQLVSQRISAEAIPLKSWNEIARLAMDYGLGPMLLWATRQRAPELVTEPLWSPILAEARAVAAHHMRFKAVQQQVNAALAEADIPALWLKGIVLAETVYPQPALRPMGDLDVLVPYAERLHAVQVLERSGGRSLDLVAVFDRDADAALTEKMIRYNNKFAFGPPPAVHLELHYRLLSTDDRLLPVERLAWFWEQTALLGDLRILRPEANLLYLCAHAVLQHDPDDLSMLRFFDIHRVIISAALDWDQVVERAVILGWTLGVERALRSAIDLFGTPVPDHVLSDLVARRPAHDYVPYARPKGKGSRSANTLSQLRRLSLTEKLHAVRKIALPSRIYMRARYAVPARRPVWPYYLYRWFDQGRDVLWALWKRPRRRPH